MPFKNYYAVLGVMPSASETDIKKKFRKLALQYHPDRNAGNDFAVVHYREIQEAYDILSDRAKRDQYNREWLLHHPGVGIEAYEEVSPAAILKNCQQLQRQLKGMDPFRVNQRIILSQLNKILQPDNIGLLRFHNETPINRQIVELLLEVNAVLPKDSRARVVEQLREIASDDANLICLIGQEEKKVQRRRSWERYSPLLALLIAMIVCMLIYLLSRKSG